jgi:hypothetical protein
MSRKHICTTLIALFALLLGGSVVTAQEPEEETQPPEIAVEDISIAATLNSRISYQGILEEDGEPVTGNRNMTFGLYSDSSCTTLVRSLGSQSVAVAEGLFSQYLDVTHADFNGQALWLKVSVESAALDCLDILPAPYALSLRPGADVFGSVPDQSVVFAHNTASSGDSYGLRGRSDSPDGRGVYGYAGASSGTAAGVYGRSFASGGRGVRGDAISPSGTNYGVYGSSISTDGRGVYGLASSSSGITYGVYGRTSSASDTAAGVYGYAGAASGTTYGVYGKSDSDTGVGVVGHADTMGVLGVSDSIGVAGAVLASGTTYGVQGQVASSASGASGVYGLTTANSGATYGIHGKSNSTDQGRGVYGEAPKYGVYGQATASSGNTYGVYGTTDRGFDGYGVYGKNTNANQGTGVYGEGGAYGVHGKSTSTLGSDAGVYGEGYYGVYGDGSVYGVYATGSTGVYATGSTAVDAQGDTTGVNAEGDTYGVEAYSDGTAVFGSTYGSSGIAVHGYAGTNGANRAIYGRSDSSTGVGVLAHNYSTGVGLAAYSWGGNIIEGWAGDPGVATRRFRIDQPGNVYADGRYYCGQSSSCYNTGTGADVAERIDGIEALEPGDVVEIDPDTPNHFRLAYTPYSTFVAGVVSSQPGITLGNDFDPEAPDENWNDDRPLLALVGRVPVKVSAENGPIAPGDLLVSSAMPGHAMKAGPNPPVGTVVGKALEGLDAEIGVIQMLVMLR